MPSPSYWPIVLAIALPIMAYGIIFTPLLTVVRRRDRAARHASAGRWSRRSPTTADYDPPPQGGDEPRRSWRPLADTDRSRRPPPDAEPAAGHEPSHADARRHAITAATASTHGGQHGHLPPGCRNNKLAMWLFLGSECLLFGGLISTYMLYRGRHTGSPGPAQLYDIPLTSVSQLRAADELADDGARGQRGAAARRSQHQLWLTVTALLGATFVGAQVYEFTSFYHEGLGFTTSLFSSSFFTLTGFHGVHVTVGIIMLMSLVGIIVAQQGARRQGRGRRAHRPLLALRRHRLDRHLHPRLPDPGMRSHHEHRPSNHRRAPDDGTRRAGRPRCPRRAQADQLLRQGRR